LLQIYNFVCYYKTFLYFTIEQNEYKITGFRILRFRAQALPAIAGRRTATAGLRAPASATDFAKASSVKESFGWQSRAQSSDFVSHSWP
jgi:hypothetical protein